MQLATTTLASVSPERLKKAVDGYVDGTYSVPLTRATDAEISGFVANSDGIEYGVVITAGRVFCSCKDAMYRGGICKHAAGLALFAIRQPQAVQPPAPVAPPVRFLPEPTEGPVEYSLKLTRVRKNYSHPA